MRRVLFYRPFKFFTFPGFYVSYNLFQHSSGRMSSCVLIPNIKMSPWGLQWGGAKGREQLEQLLPVLFQRPGLFRWRAAPGVAPPTHTATKHIWLGDFTYMFCMQVKFHIELSWCPKSLYFYRFAKKKKISIFHWKVWACAAEQDILSLFWQC